MGSAAQCRGSFPLLAALVVTLFFVVVKLRSMSAAGLAGSRSTRGGGKSIEVSGLATQQFAALQKQLVADSSIFPDPPFYVFPDRPEKRVMVDDERLKYPFLSIAQGLNKTRGLTPELSRWTALRSKAPRLIYLHNVIAEPDASDLIAFASKYLERSAVNDNKTPGNSLVLEARSSNGMFLTDGRGSTLPANVRLRRRVASVVGLPVECSETTQILRYENNQQYRAHFDTFQESNKITLARGGQRMATAIIWLTDVALGGTTTFPNSRNPTVSVPPRKGDGLIFYTIKEDFRTVDFTHTHSGDPVLNGTKFVAVMWFHARVFT